MQKMNKHQQIVYDFIDAINQHDLDRIYSLMAKDFKFIDAYGGEETGKDHMRESWIGYFKWFSDYKIEIVDTFANEDTYAILGYASGTYHNTEDHWRLPAAWKVVVYDHEIKLWQVYCDSKIPFEIIEKNK